MQIAHASSISSTFRLNFPSCTSTASLVRFLVRAPHSGCNISPYEVIMKQHNTVYIYTYMSSGCEPGAKLPGIFWVFSSAKEVATFSPKRFSCEGGSYILPCKKWPWK